MRHREKLRAPNLQQSSYCVSARPAWMKEPLCCDSQSDSYQAANRLVVCAVEKHGAKGRLLSWVTWSRKAPDAIPVFRTMYSFKISPTFHLTFSDYSWLQVTETSGSEKANNGGLLRLAIPEWLFRTPVRNYCCVFIEYSQWHSYGGTIIILIFVFS